jgi:hypothetical protein
MLLAFGTEGIILGSQNVRPCLSVFEVDVGMFKVQTSTRVFAVALNFATLAWAGLFKCKC